MTNPQNYISFDIIDFCATECELQKSGEMSVARMVKAYSFALFHNLCGFDAHDVLTLGLMVEPMQNRNGFRKTPITVGEEVIGWQNIPRQVENLCSAQDTLTPAEWFYEFERIHPFVDGNGRTGQILFNLLSGTLSKPTLAPKFVAK